MSSRVLRKLGLQGEKEITCINDDASDTEADFSSSSGTKKKQLNLNRYDLLNQQSHSESEVKEDDDHETAGSMNNHEGAIDLKDSSRRKKKKKKKKSGKLPGNNARSSEDNIEDEVERSVREVNEILGEMPSVSQAAQSDAASLRKGVLTVEHRALNPNNELRRIFGYKILQNEQVKKRGRSRGHLKSTFLVSPKENWPPLGKPGLSMKLVESKNGVNYFNYEHSLNYQQVQMRFLVAVESLNPDNIVSIINMSPYHVDGLLQLSELCRLSEDISMAAELVQRAIYCLEMAFHPSFSLTSGNSRLDYRKQENRSLYIALFKHALFVGSRACCRTALEFCKLILSFEPEKDPLAVVLIIDFYALRAQEYEWLIKIAKEWESSRNLSQLPNFAYSTAIAHFQLGETEVAHTLLQDALIKFPGVLLPLMEKCGASLDSRVSTNLYFTKAKSTQSNTLSQLETMYVERCYHAWKEAGLLPWLERNTHAALDRIEQGDPLVAVWKEGRMKRFASTPRNIHRHIILSDLKETHLLLNDEFHTPVLNFDPLPPLDSIDLYSRPVRTHAVGNDGPLAIFFRSIIPNFNVNAPPAAAGEESVFDPLPPLDPIDSRPVRTDAVGNDGPLAVFFRSLYPDSNVNEPPAAADSGEESVFDPLPPLDPIDSRPVRTDAVGNDGPLAVFFRSLYPDSNVNEPPAAADSGEESVFDPLPPLDPIDSRPVRTDAVGNDGPLAVFLRSLYPDSNVNEPPAAADSGDESDEGGLRRSVALLLDAMRDLLSNIHLPDVPGDGDVEDADSDDPPNSILNSQFACLFQEIQEDMQEQRNGFSF